MKRFTFLLFAAIGFSPAIVLAQAPARQAAPRPPALVKLNLQARAPGRPALKYHLLPELSELQPGNAAATYYLANIKQQDTSFDQFSDWLYMPIDKLLKDAIREGLRKVEPALHFAHIAARRDHCLWGLTVHTDGFGTLLPHLQHMRNLTRALAVRGRLQIAEHDFDGAMETLRTGLAMARHLNQEAVVIQQLVAVGMTEEMMQHIGMELIQAPDSPNLYWGLANLPRPFHDSPEVIQYERSIFEVSFPSLRNLESGRLTLSDWNDFVEKLPLLVGPGPNGGGFDKAQLSMAVFSVQAYPEAKKFLLSKGMTPEKVDAMPVHVALATYLIEGYRDQAEELYKWYGLPYWQAREGMDRAQVELEKSLQSGGAFNHLFAMVVPSLNRARSRAVRADQSITVLQCIEAIRAYAAAHEGKLPPSLDAITETPAPHDPFTNQPFSYELTGDTAVLDVPLPVNLPRRYEITIVK